MVRTIWTSTLLLSCSMLPCQHPLQGLAGLDLRGAQWVHAEERLVDRERTRAIATEALGVLAQDPAPLARFVAGMLATVPRDEDLLRKAHMAMVQAVHQVPEDPALAVLQLRLAVTLGRTVEGERLLADLKPHWTRDPTLAAQLAEALTWARDPDPWRATALDAFESCWPGDAQDLFHERLRYLVLDRFGTSAEAEHQLDLLCRHSGLLNNDCWYMVTMAPWRGRFDRLALAYAERMVAAGTDLAEADTVALVFYKNGALDRALELQRRAIDLGGQGNYLARMDRYSKAKARQRGARTGGKR